MGTLKIKKVDDKPMVIHTKKKAKIHMHEPQKTMLKYADRVEMTEKTVRERF